MPPKAIRDLRDYTRTRTRLAQERTRCWQRLEKLLEGALVKVSSVASKLTTVSAQDMIKAMIAGQRDPQALAALARTGMRAKRDELAEALDGMFDDHHGELARMLLDQIAFLDGGSRRCPPGPPSWPRRSPPPGASTPTGPPARTPAPGRTPRCCPPWPGWRRSPASAPTWPGPSSPKWAWT